MQNGTCNETRSQALRLILKKRLAELGSVGVAFSSGVDSALLLAVAHEALGDRAVAFTAISPANPQGEDDDAIAFCEERGIRHVTFTVNQLEEIDGFERNPKDRCYICKQHLFVKLKELARAEGLAHVVEGSNVDDLGEFRPGNRALAELGIASPLLDCGFTKQDIRDLSHELGLPTWDKPSLACLYTRFPYGELVTPEALRRVDEAERFLLDHGFRTVRVRSVGDTARIEVAPADIERLSASPLREKTAGHLKALGFASVEIDPRGYRTGSMDES